MPKKKPKPRKTPSQRRRHQGAPHRHTAPAAVPALLAELEEWARELDLFIEDSTWLVERAIDLKREQLASPDPTAWTEQEIRAVLTEAFPRSIATTADDARLLVPAMTLFFSFLLSTGRFRSALTDAALTALMEELATEVPQALEDPTRRSMGGNLVRYAVEQGVDVSDPAPAPARPGTAFGLAGGPAPDGGTREEPVNPFARIWPSALGHAPDLTALSSDPVDAARAAELFERSVLLRRARQLLDWLGDGRPVTSTGALRLADTTAVMGLLGISSHTAPRSMWWVRDLVLLWVALVRLGYLEVGRTRVTPGEEALPGGGAAPEEVATVGAGLHAAVLHAFLEDRPDRPSVALEPDLTLAALLRAAEPEGLTMPARDDALPSEDDHRVRYLGRDLDILAALGMLEREGSTYRLPAALHLIVPVAVRLLVDG